MERCSKGHYYEVSKHSSCPHCGINIDLNFERTMTKQQVDFPKTQAKVPSPPSQNDSNKTIGIVRKNLGIDPVVGWLICIEGAQKGRDFRIHSERNFIGRSDKMDIAITGDESISRENHAIVSYSPKKQNFRIYPGDSRGLVYLNDEEVINPEELQPYDVIELGQTKLIFIPFCGKKFQWK
ncbi:FHA domain-containing protein [Bacillus taeanensis]|uniref:FHA domain-containing protein n=1 Tax=Bacillus taeanensis TaxID=273032 RepID=A0A366XS41_9BACI|nr:FHA domain-containing protein [Bacillus taeanensis]RBW68952.1 FHA domain-containing protein [Bacillus taeanensis]